MAVLPLEFRRYLERLLSGSEPDRRWFPHPFTSSDFDDYDDDMEYALGRYDIYYWDFNG